ncbi:MAG: LacI family transcriptional regulator [Litorilinea sp.]|nr:MAG: LacI family transcriptional regulator [Litorilinea sp.]
MAEDRQSAVRPRRPTQADVARLAGVSQALVSYVLNDAAHVSIPPETRQRILDAVAELGYVPNTAARSLRTSRTFTIASIIPDITNPFYPAFERGIQDVAEPHGYDLIVYNTDGRREKEQKALRSISQARADGIIGVFFHVTARELFPLLEMGIPVVRLEATFKPPGAYPLDNLCVNNVAAARAAVTYLIDQGHRRIAMLTWGEGPGDARVSGYREALAAHGLPAQEEWIRICPFTEEGGYTGMQELLRLAMPPTAVFAANDIMALGALMALRETGLRVPQDVAVMGFDDIPTARLVSPALTTVSQFQRELGRRAAEMLLERLQGQGPPGGRSEEMPYAIVARESA